MTIEIPTNYELTAAEVALALKEFTFHDLGAQQGIRRYRAMASSMSSKMRRPFRRALRKAEDHLKKERSEMITATENLYEDALARLTAHDCAVVPGYLNQIKDMMEEFAVEGEPPVPLALSEEKVEHYEAILEITRVFLHAMGSRMGNWD